MKEINENKNKQSEQYSNQFEERLINTQATHKLEIETKNRKINELQLKLKVLLIFMFFFIFCRQNIHKMIQIYILKTAEPKPQRTRNHKFKF